MKLNQDRKQTLFMLGMCSLLALIVWCLSYNSSHSVKQRAWDALPVHVQQARTDEKNRKARVYQTLKFQFQTDCIETISQYSEASSDAMEECYDYAWRNAEKIVALGLEKNYE